MSKSTATLTMDELLASNEVSQLAVGDVVEGKVTSIKKNEVWIDLGARGVGVVMRREIGYGQQLEEGQTITVSVIDPEMDEGHALLSMKRAVKDRGWDELQRVHEANEIIEVVWQRTPVERGYPHQGEDNEEARWGACPGGTGRDDGNPTQWIAGEIHSAHG